MIKGAELLGVLVSPADKALLRKVAVANQLTMSDVVRMILRDGIRHWNERGLLKPV